MRHIEVFADVLCPFTHVGLRRLAAARDAAGSDAHLRVRAWPLELINGEPLSVDLVAHEIDDLRGQVASDLFTGFDENTFPGTSIPAFGLVAAAYAVNYVVGEEVSLAVRTALFEHGLDISDAAVLGALADRFHVTPIDPVAVDSAVRTDWERGKARGVQGSPHFFADGHDWFCPGLDIRKAQGHLEIHPGRQMEEFYATILA